MQINEHKEVYNSQRKRNENFVTLISQNLYYVEESCKKFLYLLFCHVHQLISFTK